ncbi:Transmembrane protein 109 [Podarcis lilfordi]|uniref:Transmembrane protein 109 n=1 Tax=Podarcis lilfordi TaxID=74358 RepID=A0AA35JN23_9SAUR|nr:Transmembrane protein 109 [Podarcis lilfordi]
MTRWGLSLRSCFQPLPKPILAVVALLVLTHIGITDAQQYRNEPKRAKYAEPDFLSQVGRAMSETMEDLIGRENFRILNENISSLVWMVSSGISAALFVVAQITGQLLTSFGIAGERATQFLKLNPEQVQTALLWGLAALLGYWVLSLLLSVLVAILSRIMWGLKFVLFGACFMFIVTSVPDRSVQTMLLSGLLTLYVLLGWLSGSNHSGARLEAEVRSLKCQVAELQRRQRRSAKHLDEE